MQNYFFVIIVVDNLVWHNNEKDYKKERENMGGKKEDRYNIYMPNSKKKISARYTC